ncbi:MAG: type II toxin-antitoxin system HicA family toxin [Terriglobia bacterium]
MASYTPKVKDVLRAQGCRFERAGRGDHEMWYSPLTKRYFPVDHKILSRHTANAVLKQAGIPKQF